VSAVAEGAPPLVEIERRAQERAKDLALDMAADTGEAGLRNLIDDELTRWSDEFKRGLRAHDLPNPEIVADRAFRNLVRFGPLTPLLEDDDVWYLLVVVSRARMVSCSALAPLRSVSAIDLAGQTGDGRRGLGAHRVEFGV